MIKKPLKGYMTGCAVALSNKPNKYLFKKDTEISERETPLDFDIKIVVDTKTFIKVIKDNRNTDHFYIGVRKNALSSVSLLYVECVHSLFFETSYKLKILESSELKDFDETKLLTKVNVDYIYQWIRGLTKEELIWPEINIYFSRETHLYPLYIELNNNFLCVAPRMYD
jgi:hypothetical protein